MTRTARAFTLFIALGLVALLVNVAWQSSQAQSQEKASTQSQTSTQSQNERTVEDRIPTHIPIKVKLKKDKESKVKSLTNEKWAHDLQLEITNTSSKPIYYVSLWVIMVDVFADDSSNWVFPVSYGRSDFIKMKTLPNNEDVPIKPGETVTIHVSESLAQGWDVRVTERLVSQPRKLAFKLVHLSFGDGSGFNGAGTPFPYRRAANTCREGPPSPTLTFFATVTIPAFMPVSFFLPLIPDLALTPDPPDVCCPGALLVTSANRARIRANA